MLYKIWQAIGLTFWFPMGTGHTELTHEEKHEGLQMLGEYFAFRCVLY